MRNRLIRKYLPIVCLLVSSLYVNLVLAGWSDDQSKGYYNQRFGAFPPLDIDQQLQDKLSLQEGMITDEQLESQSQDNSDTGFYNSYQPDLSPEHKYSEQKSQQPNNLSHDQGRSVSSLSGGTQKKRSRSPRKKKRGSGFDFPWDNSGSGFTTPWNNNGSGFSAPWNNRGSSFSGPWNNKGSGISAPWSNNGSGFSAPWDNNGSGFGPWGNRRGR